MISPELPGTPDVNKVRSLNQDGHTPTMSKASQLLDDGTPPGSPMYQVKYKDYQSAIEAIQQLENELNEFQTSSYELEKELEKELTALELENTKLKDRNVQLIDDLREQQHKRFEVEKSYNMKITELNEKIQKLNSEIDSKNSALVDIEIRNDSIEQNERNLTFIYKELEEKYNVATEKVIILETEMSDLKDSLLREQLTHQNTRNELSDIKSKYDELMKQVQRGSTNTQTEDEDNINNGTENKATGATRKPSMTKSNSLMQLHTMIESTKDMESKIGNIKTSLNTKGLKFNKKAKTTTKLTSASITTSTPLSNPKPRRASKKIPLSPSSYQLSSLANSSHVATLDKIEGSPNKEAEGDFIRKKSYLFGGVLGKKR